MTLSIAHICILTNDLRATESFYTRALGMTKVFNFHKEGKLYGYYLEMSPKNYLEVFEDDGVTHRSSAFLHLCLETDNIEDAKKRINDAGVETTNIEKGCDNTLQIWFKDPNGIDIELHQYTDKSSQLTGLDCEVDWD